MALNLGAVVMKLDGDASGLMSATNKANMALAGVNKFAGDVGKQGLTALNDGFTATGNLIKTGLVVGVGAGIGAFSLMGSQAIKQAGDFEIYRATLTTMLGTQEKANARLKEYAEIGAKTPFELDQVVALGNQLQAMGKYSRDNVIMLGDLSAAAGKPIDQVGAAYSKLVTGQKGMAVDMFRDLLITTDDWVKATGKGVNKNGELMATTEDMLKVLPKIMADKKFSGMMDMQSQTFQGKWSNMLDAINGKLRDFGEKMLPIIKPYLDQFINFITNLDISGTVDSFQNLFNVLFLGDFTGKIFGIMEDDPLIETLFQIREGFQKIYGFITSGTPEAQAILVGLATTVGGILTGGFVTLIISGISPFLLIMSAVGLAVGGLFYLLQTNLPLFGLVATLIGGVIVLALYAQATALWAQVPPLYAVAMGWLAVNWPMLLIIGTIALVVGAGLWLWQNWSWLWPMIVNVARQAWTGISGFFGGIGAWFGDRFNEVKGHFDSLMNKANEIKNGIVSAFKGIQNGIGDALTSVVKALIGNINNAVGGVNKVIKNLPNLPGIGKVPEIPTIPGFKNGVTNFEGGLAYVHKDEMLMNLPQGTDVVTASDTKKMINQDSGSDTPANVYMTFNISGSNPEEIARKVAEILAKNNRNTGLGMDNAYA